MKNVLKTGLVGLKPADQVILKGYLRVLLRLEVDFEWVSANHTQVDLFVIHNEFRNSSAIEKLLEKHANTPALYVNRIDKHSNSGGLHGDLLSIPIREMSGLNNWLFANVALLRDFGDNISQHVDEKVDYAETTNYLDDNEKRELQKRADNQLADNNTVELINSKTAGQSKKAIDSNPATQTKSPKANNSQINDYNQLCETIKMLKLNAHGTLQIIQNEQTLATIELSKRLVWTNAALIASNDVSISDWHITSTNRSSAVVADAHNLKQWLWLISKNNSDILNKFVDKSKKYRAAYWVKPEKHERREVLAVLTALEKNDLYIDEIIAKTHLDEPVVLSILARLLFAGYLRKNNYENIRYNHNHTEITNSNNFTEQTRITEQDTTPATAHTNTEPAISPLEAVLSKRAAGETNQAGTTSSIPETVLSADANKSTTQSVNESAAAAVQETTTNNKKLGFLSRLRKKLGI